jgi:Ca2+-binding EF-hand superfamily protein
MGNTTTNLRPAVVQDLRDSTAFSEAELSELYRQFLKDSNGKLYLTKEEFEKMYRDVFPAGDASSFAEHVFRTFDKTREGKINFRDFIVTLSVQLRGSQAEKMDWLFDLYDYDQSGYISKEDLVKVIEVSIWLSQGHGGQYIAKPRS